MLELRTLQNIAFWLPSLGTPLPPQMPCGTNEGPIQKALSPAVCVYYLLKCHECAIKHNSDNILPAQGWHSVNIRPNAGGWGRWVGGELQQQWPPISPFEAGFKHPLQQLPGSRRKAAVAILAPFLRLNPGSSGLGCNLQAQLETM